MAREPLCVAAMRGVVPSLGDRTSGSTGWFKKRRTANSSPDFTAWKSFSAISGLVSQFGAFLGLPFVVDVVVVLLIADALLIAEALEFER